MLQNTKILPQKILNYCIEVVTRHHSVKSFTNINLFQRLYICTRRVVLWRFISLLLTLTLT